MRPSLARLIPSIERLRLSPRARRLEEAYGQTALIAALRAAADDLRAALSASDADSRAGAGVNADAHADAATIEATVIDEATARLARRFHSRLQPVINATGVIIHTNLGRAPLAAEALVRVQAIGAGYSSLEYDLEAGRRGRRDLHAEPLLRDLTGAEAAIIVNNNAAAVLLMLTALAQGREVLISRGELVEIGGGFRVPDVMRQSGALLREVGTTNRTRVADYAAAIGERTALILRVHPSNFVIEGFTERPDLRELTALGRRFNVPVVEDLGSGFFEDGAATTGGGDTLHEPTVQESVRAGVDVATFSGDKLLGGPQAGVIVGRAPLVDAMRRHPLLRALRVDKLTYAALEGTLIEIARGRGAASVPVLRMLALGAAEIGERAARVAARLTAATSRGTAVPPITDASANAGANASTGGGRAALGVDAAIVDGVSAIGGGSAPGTRLPTRLLALTPRDGRSADAWLARLRRLDPPVIARIEDDRVLLDLRTVAPDQDPLLADLLIAALAAP